MHKPCPHKIIGTAIVAMLFIVCLVMIGLMVATIVNRAVVAAYAESTVLPYDPCVGMIVERTSNGRYVCYPPESKQNGEMK